jgi:hypothetical protein
MSPMAIVLTPGASRRPRGRATFSGGGVRVGDEERRAAERRWRETGAAEDGRRYLATLTRAGEEVEALRVRVAMTGPGALHPERLDLAAHLGHAPALAALEREAPAQSLADWASGLHQWGHPACVRAAVAAARAAVATHAPREGDADAVRAIEAAEAWLACPCRKHYAEAEAFNRLRGRLPEWAWEAVTSSHCAPRACWHHRLAIQAAARALGEEATRAAVRDALVPWALDAAGGDVRLDRAEAEPAGP